MSDSGSDGFFVEEFVSPEEIEEMEAQARAEEIFSSGKPYPVASGVIFSLCSGCANSLPTDSPPVALGRSPSRPSSSTRSSRPTNSPPANLPFAADSPNPSSGTLANPSTRPSRSPSSMLRATNYLTLSSTDRALWPTSLSTTRSSPDSSKPSWWTSSLGLIPRSAATTASTGLSPRRGKTIHCQWIGRRTTRSMYILSSKTSSSPCLTSPNSTSPLDIYDGFIAYTVLFRLTSIKIPSISVALIHCLPNLTSLDWTLYDEDADFNAGRAHPPQLQQVHLQLELSTSEPNELVPFFDWLIRVSHDSLTRLSLPFHPLFQPTLAPFNNLSHFKLTIHTALQCSPPFDLPAFTKLLQSITSSLKSLFILVRVTTLPLSTSLPHSYLARLSPTLIVLALDSDTFPPLLVAELVEDAERTLPRLKRVVLSHYGPTYDNSRASRNEPWRAGDFELFKRLCASKGIELDLETEA